MLDQFYHKKPAKKCSACKVILVIAAVIGFASLIFIALKYFFEKYHLCRCDLCNCDDNDFDDCCCDCEEDDCSDCCCDETAAKAAPDQDTDTSEE